MSQDKSVLKYRDNSVKVFPVKSHLNVASIFPVKSVVRFRVKFPNNNVGMCLDRSAIMCQNNSVRVFPDNNAGECGD